MRKPRFLKKDISIEKVFPSGAWGCSVWTDTEWLHCQYFYYTKREAINQFYEDYK
jgi:hypothetical protein